MGAAPRPSCARSSPARCCRNRARARVMGWLNRQELTALHLTTISLAELRFGIARPAPGKRGDDLESRLGRMMAEVFQGRRVGFDAAAAEAFGPLYAIAAHNGHGVSFADGAIAAAIGYPVASRDTATFAAMGMEVVDPWHGAAQGR